MRLCVSRVHRQANPITSGERWALVIFYRVGSKVGQTTVSSVKTSFLKHARGFLRRGKRNERGDLRDRRTEKKEEKTDI